MSLTRVSTRAASARVFVNALSRRGPIRHQNPLTKLPPYGNPGSRLFHSNIALYKPTRDFMHLDKKQKEDLLAIFRKILENSNVCTDPEDMKSHLQSWRSQGKQSSQGSAFAVLYPRNSQDLMDILKVLQPYHKMIRVSVQSGNTGLVETSIPPAEGDNIVISMKKWQSLEEAYKLSNFPQNIESWELKGVVYCPVNNMIILPRKENIHIEKLCQEIGKKFPSGFQGKIQVTEGIILNFALCKDKAITPDSFDQATVIVAPGITLDALNEALERFCLIIPIDFGASGSATMAGMVATNTAGTRANEYGQIVNFVTSTKVMLPGMGKVIEVKGCGDLVRDRKIFGLESLIAPKEQQDKYPEKVKLTDGNYVELEYRKDMKVDNSVIHPMYLLSGSAGLFGIVQEIELKTKKIERREACFIGTFVNDSEKEKFTKILSEKCKISQCELISEPALRAANQSMADRLFAERSDDTLRFCYLIEVTPQEGTESLEGLEELLQDHVLNAYGTAIAEAVLDGHHLIQEVRHAIPGAIKKLSSTKTVMGFDVAFPKHKKLEDCLREIGVVLKENFGNRVVFCPFGHLSLNAAHANVPINIKEGDVLTEEEKQKIKKDVYSVVNVHGGSVSAEHGLGPNNFRHAQIPRTTQDFWVCVMNKMNPDGFGNPILHGLFHGKTPDEPTIKSSIQR